MSYSTSSSPTVIPHQYRSKNPEDYVVQHLLDEDEIEDVLLRENASASSSDHYYSPSSRNTEDTTRRNNSNINNNNFHSGLPPSQILHQPKEPIGRPFGGAPPNLNLPQPPVSLTGMKPRHY